MFDVLKFAKGSPLENPFVPNKKLIWGAVIGAAGSVLNGLLGSSSQSDANETNLEIAKMNQESQREANKINQQNVRETNAQNYKLFQEQNAFNLDMWNKQNAYNDPKAQVNRLLAAGINPASGLGNVSEAGSLTSANGSPSVAPLVQPETLDFQKVPFTDYSFIPQGVNAYFQNQLLNKQVQEKDVDTQIKKVELSLKGQEILSNISNRIADTQSKLSNAKLTNEQRLKLEEELSMLRSQHNLIKDTYSDLVKREKLQNDLLNEQKNNLVNDSALKRAQTAYQNMLVAYYPSMSKAQLNLMSAQLEDTIQSAALKVKEGVLKDAETTSQYIKNRVDSYHESRELLKHRTRNGNKASKVFYGTLDMIGESLFSNIRLFGK